MGHSEGVAQITYGNAKHRVSADSRGHSRLHNPAPNRKPVGLSGPLESVAPALGLDGLQHLANRLVMR